MYVIREATLSVFMALGGELRYRKVALSRDIY